MTRRFVSYWELLQELTLREIKSRYKQSVLGYAWVILNPLLQMSIMAFIFSKLIRIPNLTVPYSIFLYAGLLPWTLLANSLTGGINSLVNNASLITKVYIPREIFVASSILSKLVDFLLATIVFIGLLLIYRIPLTWNALWVIPILIIQIGFMYGLALFFSALNLFYRDVQYVMNLVLVLWMYATPIIYSADIFPAKYKILFQINPMAVIINAYRQTILGGGMPNLVSLGTAAGLSALVILVGYFFFRRWEGVFADVI